MAALKKIFLIAHSAVVKLNHMIINIIFGFLSYWYMQ